MTVRPGPIREVPLPGTDWSVWSHALLRSTGFPAAGLDLLAAHACAAAADAHLRAPGDVHLAHAFADALDKTVGASTETLRQIAGERRFRTAVTWQSASAVAALDGLTRTATDAPRNNKARERERLVTKYWQRYCGKTETIGFFGPVCWIDVDPDAPAITVDPGVDLVRERVVRYEWWVLDALAATLAADPAARPWLPVTREPHHTLVGPTVLRPGQGTLELPASEAGLLEHCDGRTAREVAVAAVASDPALRKPGDALLLLERLAAAGLVRWGIQVPYDLTGEAGLRAAFARIGDGAVRERAEGMLARLDDARARIGHDDPVLLSAALRELADRFTTETGSAAERDHGQAYAGRSVCVEDTTRDLDATLGGPVLATLATPLGLVLSAARWLTAALAGAYHEAFVELYDELAVDGAGNVPLGELWYLANGLLFGAGPRPVDQVLVEFVGRWQGLLGLDRYDAATSRVDLSGAELLAPATRLFDAAGPGWATARLHSPDLHLCADSVEALRRGEFHAVLGELHAAWLTCNAHLFVLPHADRDALLEALARAVGPRVVPLYPTDWPRHTARVADGLVGPDDLRLGFVSAPVWEPERVLAVTGLSVSLDDGVLTARAADGRRWPLLELLGEFLGMFAADAYKVVGAGPHTPRVTIDNLVVARETWRTTVGECPLVSARGEAETYLAGRRWRHTLGLPERVFVRIGTEVKPTYADLTSPAYVDVLARMLRAAGRTGGAEVPVVVSEMLPTPEQAWLPDAAGRRYFAELRLTCVDSREVLR